MSNTTTTPAMSNPTAIERAIANTPSQQVIGEFHGSYKDAQLILFKQANEMLDWKPEMSHALAIRVAVDFSQAMKQCSKEIVLGKVKKAGEMPLKELSKSAILSTFPLQVAYCLQECAKIRSQGALGIKFSVKSDWFDAIRETALKFFPSSEI